MNERIRELAEQAYKEVVETNDYNGSAYTVREFDKQKFAQLLLEEVSQHLTNKGLDHAREVIEKEFGI